MVKKPEMEDDEDWIENYDGEDAEEVREYFNEPTFECRVCNKECTVDSGDDYILICDECAENYNMDKMWNDFDTGKLTEEQLKSVDLEKYKFS